MTPQQKKADELVERFMDVPECENHFSRHAYGYVCNHQAIQCAIICVEEKLEEAKWWHKTNSYEETTDYEGSVQRISELESVLNELKLRL